MSTGAEDESNVRMSIIPAQFTNSRGLQQYTLVTAHTRERERERERERYLPEPVTRTLVELGV